MPWKVEKMENLKKKFIVLYDAGAGSMTELCRQFGISRPTGYAIVKRLREEGWDALEERARRHHGHPSRTSAAVEQALLKERDGHPRWGARKLLVMVRRAMPELALPAGRL